MKKIHTIKVHTYGDFIICLMISLIYVFIASRSKIEINLFFLVRNVLVFWLTYASIRGIRLLQYMVSFDLGLASVVSQVNDMEIPFKYKFKDWKKFIKKPLKKSLPIAIVLLFVHIVLLRLHMPRIVYLNIVTSLLLVYVSIFWLYTVREMIAFISDFKVKHKQNADGAGYGVNEIKQNIKAGLILGILFIVPIMLFLDMNKYHCFLFYYAFSMLYFFNKTLIDLYGLFSNAVYSVVGFKLDNILFKK